MTAVSRIYLDHNATTPLRPEARAAMTASLDVFGNPSSVHAEGRRARSIVEAAREQVAALVGARPSQVVFTSGATESNAWVVAGPWQRILVGATEHASLLAPASLAAADVSEISVDGEGTADLAALAALLAAGDDAGAGTLVSLQLANSETGTRQPVMPSLELARQHGAVFHTDAVQAVGRESVDFNASGYDLMSVSAHKLGGPKGIGALVIRDGLELTPLVRGGGQERRRRGGTEAVTLIAGFGAAAEAAHRTLGDWRRIDELRGRLEAGVRAATPDALVLGAGAPRLPNTVCIAKPGADASTLLIKLDLAGVAVSAGSACSSGKIGGSHVLAAMNVGADLAKAAIRVSLGWPSTAADVTAFIDAWSEVAGRARTSTRAPAEPADAGLAARTV